MTVTERLVKWQAWIRYFSLEDAEELSILLDAAYQKMPYGDRKTLVSIRRSYGDKSREKREKKRLKIEAEQQQLKLWLSNLNGC